MEYTVREDVAKTLSSAPSQRNSHSGAREGTVPSFCKTVRITFGVRLASRKEKSGMGTTGFGKSALLLLSSVSRNLFGPSIVILRCVAVAGGFFKIESKLAKARAEET